MPEIIEDAKGTLGKKVGPLPIGAWALVVVGGFVAVRFLRGGGSGGGGGSGTVTVPDAFPGGDSGSSGGGGSGTTVPTTTPPAGSGSPASAPAKYRLTILSHTALFSTLGKLLGYGASGTYTATKVKVGGKDYYRFLRSGRWTLIPVGTKTIKVTQT